MLLTKRDIFDDIFDALDPFGPLASRPRTGLFTPLDAGIRRSVTDDELSLSVDLPGTKSEDLEITFETNGAMKIASKRSDLQLESTHRCSLGEDWDRDSAEASLEDGVLTVKLRKLEKAKPKRLLLKTK